jgi:hypothetical protein
LGLLARPFQLLLAADVPPLGDPSDLPLVAPAVRQAMQDRDYASARKAIDEAVKAKDAPTDYLAYLRAWSLHLEKKDDQAIAAFQQFEKDFPQSSWLRRARFGKAQAMIAKGDFRSAQTIYESEGKYLLSATRRQASATVYLEFADARFEPQKRQQLPDFKTAREFYALALQSGLEGPRRTETEFRVAYCLQKLGDLVEAGKAFEAFVAAHGDAPQLMEARYHLGECLLTSGRFADARKAWRELLKIVPARQVSRVSLKPGDIIDTHESVASKPQTSDLGKADLHKSAKSQDSTSRETIGGAGRQSVVLAPARRDIGRDWGAEAAYHMAETWHCPQPSNEDDLRRGVAALKDFIHSFPMHELVGQAHLQIAQSHLQLAHYDEAVATLRQFLHDPQWKNRKELPEARRLLGQVYFGGKKYSQAIAVWREYLALHTAHESWPSVQQSVIDTEYLIGQEKFKTGDYAAAAKLLTEFIDRYPLDSRNPAILFLFGQIHHRETKWEDSIADWQRLIAKYPQSEEASRAHFMIACTLEEHLSRYQEAREQYGKVTGRDAAEAQAAVAAIPAKSMQVKTERVFRSAETPQLMLATRNISSVKVRVYKIDLEAHFRKMHSIAGIQRLDVSLIDPDATLEFAVPEYTKYKPITSSLPVPLPGGSTSGVAAVTVSSPTLETTTLLIQSDLEILVRSSRDEVVVFTENMRTGQPWPGVRLLLSDGDSVFAEVKSGDDGFFHQRYGELQDAACLRVFAVAEGGHVASTAVRLNGESTVQALTDRIFVDTDRVRYVTGQTVHVRGCARHAGSGNDAILSSSGSIGSPKSSQRVAGGYVIEEGKRLTIDVLGDANRRLRRQEVSLSSVGTFHWDFPLPAGMPNGNYKIVVHDQAGHSQLAVFEIDQPEEEDLRLILDLPKTAYNRNDTIVGTLRAVLPQDRPLIGVKATYQLAGGPATETMTDSRGEVHFAIPTDDLESYGRMTLKATIPSRRLTTEREVVVATQGFSIGLTTSRSVYVAGESLDLHVKTTDVANRLVAEKLELKVLREERVGETTRDELVEEHSIVTSLDGTAVPTIKLAKGGLHTLRTTGIDHFGNRVTQELQIRVSGDDDLQQLLLLVDRTSFKAGETAEALVYWRGRPTLAVVTSHFDRLIEQRQVFLQTGMNRLAIPVTATMSPGFVLAVGVMSDSTTVRPEAGGGNSIRSNTARLHEASCALRVDADLQVKVECHRHGDAVAAPRPGELADVTITTCDAQGKPLAAEVSLALVSADGEDTIASSDRSLARFFGNHGHPAQFLSAASIQFHYRPANRVIGVVEPEEEPPVLPAHVAAQQGIVANKSAEADDPSADFKELQKLIRENGHGEQVSTAAADTEAASMTGGNPFGDDQASLRQAASEAAPARSASPRRHLDRQSERNSAVSHVTDAGWPGYWNPAIATGSDGRATISISMPEDLVELTLVAKALTPGTLTGELTKRVKLKKELSATIHLPPSFTDGDEVELPVVVENRVLDQGVLEVALGVEVDGVPWSEKKTLDVKARGRQETSFKTVIRQLQRPKEGQCLPSRSQAVVTVTVKAGTLSDVYRRSVPVLPYGMPCRVTSAGFVGGATKITLAPTYPHWATPTLQIAVSPSIQQSLLDLLAPEADATRSAREVGAASDLMAALALSKIYAANSASGRMLDERIRATLSLLLATQRDGGWATGSATSAMPANSLAFWALVLADKAGYGVPREALDSALARLRAAARNEQESDLETKAFLLHDLAIHGEGDFTLANHLLRDRKLLSPLARAYLALALAEMDRSDSAVEVLKRPESKETDAAKRTQFDPEAQALMALAWLRIDPSAPQVKPIMESVLSARMGLRWTPENAIGPAVLAAAAWLTADHSVAAPCRLMITVNGRPVKTLDLDPQGPTQTVDVPLSFLIKGKQLIELRANGTARPAYCCTLTGVEPAEFVQGTSARWILRRSYLPGLIEIDEKAVPRGFRALSGDARRAEFSNCMTQLPAARLGTVELEVFSDDGSTPAARLEPIAGDLASAVAAGSGFDAHNPSSDRKAELVIVEPLPSGARVVPSSLSGSFDRAEILPGQIVFTLDREHRDGTIRYELEGVFPGSNLISPTVLRWSGKETPLAVAKPKSLVVLPQGARSRDPYRLSPDELLHLGAITKKKGEFDASTRYYTQLLESWHGQPGFGLSDAAYKQTVVALMEMGMGRAAPAKLVQYCETIKEKWPNEPVTLDQVLTAAGAYREIGELERSYMACRAAVERNFMRENGLTGFLDDQGDFLRSVGHMNRLLRDYPLESYTAEAELELAQRVYAKAGEIAVDRGQTPAGKPKLDRDALIRRAWQMLEAFLTGNPTDPSADQAAFAAANAQLDLKHYADTEHSAASYARRYPQSELLDSYWYLQAYCDFAAGRHAEAIDVCRKVAETQHLDKQSGQMVDSTNKYRAIYILGQIYQSLGRRADAIREYRRVENRIPDAKSSVNYFVRRRISLPDCTTVKPRAAAEIELAYRNIAACDVKVYRVDLMKFCDAAQALGDLSQVNLAGIRPLNETSVALRGGADYADHTQKLALPVTKEGAYLVVCRGDDLYASGLLLISPLEIESHFDSATGQVRVFIKDTTHGKYLSDVQVKLLPRETAGQVGVVGTTDFRGVFVGRCTAAATIVAQSSGGQYAYMTTAPTTGEVRQAIASTAGQDDPTTPFTAKRSRADHPVVNRPSVPPATRVASSRPAPPRASLPERPLPPPGPNSPTLLSHEESVADRKILQALNQPTQIEFVETPLKDVIDYLQDLHHIEIQMDSPALKEAGVDESAAITKHLTGISLRSALKLILDELQLKWVIHNEVLLITSPAKAESDEYMVTKAYPVTDLVQPIPDGSVELQPLEDLLTTTVASKTWVDNGGTGAISHIIVGNRVLLVFSQSQEVHEEIESTLNMLRKAGGLKTPKQDAGDASTSGEPSNTMPRAPHLRVPSFGGGFGGMGSMGGLGGMNGARAGQRSSVTGIMPARDPSSELSGDADLLGGLKSSNSANQKAKVMQLKQRQEAGQNGGTSGGMMGGMGGGVF